MNAKSKVVHEHLYLLSSFLDVIILKFSRFEEIIPAASVIICQTL